MPGFSLTKPPIKVLSARDNSKLAQAMGMEEDAEVLDHIARRKDTIREEQQRFADMADRYDNLYYPNRFTKGGADHWPDDPNLKVKGKVHVSVNVHPTYVDVPAALQSVVPVENIVPPEAENKPVAALVERLYFAWKDDIQFETTNHKMATIKGLYGKGAAKVVWDDERKLPDVIPVEQPRNLWLGWQSNDYTKVEWAVYSYAISPEVAAEEYGLDVVPGEDEETGQKFVYVRSNATSDTMTQRDWLQGTQTAMLEVNDYWYRKPSRTPKMGQRTPMETWNVITVGNVIVREQVHTEYGGLLPYVPVFNTYVPGMPEGRPDLFDVEQLLREKDERISNGGTMAGKLVGRQFWQLTGPEAPDRVPTGLRPKPDEVIAPGAGNRVEPITPWMPEFQLEAYLARLDRELQDVSGLNDLLRGLAPAQVLSSSKAINALVANYEARITLRRQLFYQWRRNVWDLSKQVWGSKVSALKAVFEIAGKLVVKSPSLTPRDDIEQATMAINLLQNKVWGQARAMDATGVEDPEREKADISEERQNPTLFPQDVQAQVALMATMQQLQMQAAMAQQQGMGGQPAGPDREGAEGAAMEADEARRQQADRQAQGGQAQLNGPGEGNVPPEESSAFRADGDYNAVSQTMLQNGEPSNRILLQQPISGPGEGEG